MKAAEAAAATPTAASYEQHQSRRADAAAATGAKRERGSTGRADRESRVDRRAGRDSDGSSSRREQEGAVPRFPRSDDPAVQHKLRLLRSAPYTELRPGDWFCGECGAHNYAFKQLCFRCVHCLGLGGCERGRETKGTTCLCARGHKQLMNACWQQLRSNCLLWVFSGSHLLLCLPAPLLPLRCRCEVPSNSLGVSKVTAIDVRQLQQIGLGQGVAFEQRGPAAAFALQVAEAVTAALSIPAAAKATGVTKFKPVELPQQEAAAGSSGSSSSRRSSRCRDESSSSSRGERSSIRDGRQSRDSRDSRQSRGSRDGRGSRDSREKDGFEDRPWERRGPVGGSRREGGGAAEGRGEAGEPRARRSALPADGGSSGAAAAAASSSSSGNLTDAFREAFSDLQQELGLPSMTAAPAARGSRVRRLRQQDAAAAAAPGGGASRSSDDDRDTDLDGEGWQQERPGRRGLFRVGADSTSRTVSGGRRDWGPRGRGSPALGDDADSALPEREEDLSGWADDYEDVVGDTQQGRSVRWSIKKDLDTILDDRGSSRGRWEDRGPREGGRANPRGGGGYGRRGAAAGGWDGDRQERGEGWGGGSSVEEGGGVEEDGWYQRRWEQRDRGAGSSRGGGRGRRGGRGGGRRERDSRQATDKPSWVSGVWE